MKTQRKIFTLLLGILLTSTIIYSSTAHYTNKSNNNIKNTLKTRGEVLLIPDSSSDTVGLYDPTDGKYLGDIIDGAGLFQTPINAIPGPNGDIYVSDQLADAIYVFDSEGNYQLTYADSSDGLNNIRGIAFNAGYLYVTSGDDYVAKFSGPHNRQPDFINDGSDPYDIFFLTDGRALVSDIQGSSDNIRLYSATGVFQSELFSVSFPQQIQSDSQTPGEYLNMAFSADVATDFKLDGTIIETTFFNAGRGIYRLENGNLLMTAGDGVWEVEPGTGTIIEQENTGSGRFIETYSINLPPNEPSDPSPENTTTNIPINTDISWTGGDPDTGDIVTYDIYFDTNTPPQLIETEITETTYNPGPLNYTTTYYWKIIAKDNNGATTEGPIWSFTTRNQNQAPDPPTIDGTLKGKTGKEYEYSFTITDSDNDDLYLWVEWGDGCPSTNWTGPYTSGDTIKISHTYTEKGTYTIRAKVKDTGDLESTWATLEIQMPLAQIIHSHPLINWLFTWLTTITKQIIVQ